MKLFLSLAAIAALAATPAMAGSISAKFSAGKCTVTQSGTGEDAATASSCATGTELPSIKATSGDYSLLADMATKDVGGEWAICPGLSLGLTGGASTSRVAGDEKHDSRGTAYALTKTQWSDSSLEIKASASRHQAAGSLDSSAAGLNATYYLSSKSVTPFVSAGYQYSWAVLTDESKQTGTLLLGVRAKTTFKD